MEDLTAETEEAETFTAMRNPINRPSAGQYNFVAGGRAKASDVHIEVYEKSMRVRFRIDGVL